MHKRDGAYPSATGTGSGIFRSVLPALLLCALVSAPGTSPAAEPATPGMESKPLPPPTPDYSAEAEAEGVERLQHMLRRHYNLDQLPQKPQASTENLAAREAARRDAANLAKIPFSAGKVRLSGQEGSLALAQITERLSDPAIPHSRRAVAPVCSINTRLSGKLIASERRSLWPVGKHNYVARLQLHAGSTTLAMQGYSWEINLPEGLDYRSYLVTVYKPPGVKPELHVFAVDDLLALDDPDLPAWLPEQLELPGPG